jgi:hypothetical protein
MTEITIQIPDSLSKVLPVLKKPFLLRVMRNLAKTKIEENKEQLKAAQKHIHTFEKRYATTFEEFKANFPPDADLQSHEDFVEWSFWVDVRNGLNEEINTFKKLNGTQK